MCKCIKLSEILDVNIFIIYLFACTQSDVFAHVLNSKTLKTTDGTRRAAIDGHAFACRDLDL